MLNTKAMVMSRFKLTVLICLCFQLTIILSHSTTDPLRSGNWSFCWRMHAGWLYAPFFWAGKKTGGYWFIYLDLVSSCILLTLTLCFLMKLEDAHELNLLMLAFVVKWFTFVLPLSLALWSSHIFLRRNNEWMFPALGLWKPFSKI